MFPSHWLNQLFTRFRRSTNRRRMRVHPSSCVEPVERRRLLSGATTNLLDAAERLPTFSTSTTSFDSFQFGLPERGEVMFFRSHARIDVPIAFDIFTRNANSEDLVVRVFDKSGELIDEGVDPAAHGQGNSSYLHLNVPATDDYYFGISWNADGDYDPLASTLAFRPRTEPVVRRENSIRFRGLPRGQNTSAQQDEWSESVPLHSETQRHRHDIHTADEVHIYHFDASVGDIIEIEANSIVHNASRPTDSLDPFVRIFNSDGVQIRANNTIAATLEPTRRERTAKDAGLRFRVRESGRYYVGISSVHNIKYDPSNGRGDRTSHARSATGSYYVQFRNVTENRRSVDKNDAFTDRIGGYHQSDTLTAIEYSFDVDLIEIEGQIGDRIDVDVDSNGTEDLLLSIFDSTGRLIRRVNNRLAADDLSSSVESDRNTTDPYVRFRLPATGKFYAAISLATNRNFDPSDGTGDREVRRFRGPYHYSTQIINIDKTLREVGDDLDDTFDEATLYSPRGDNSGRPNEISHFGDVDFRKLDVPANTIVRVTASSDAKRGMLVRVYDENRREIDRFVATKQTDLPFSQSGGTRLLEFDEDTKIYVSITTLQNGRTDLVLGTGDTTVVSEETTGKYKIGLSTVAPPPHDDAHDSISEAIDGHTIRPSITSQHYFGELTHVRDVQVFRFFAFRGEIIEFDVTTDARSNTDTFLRLFDESGRQLRGVDNRKSPAEEKSANSSDVDPFLRYRVKETGFLYVSVSLATNRAFNVITGDGDTYRNNYDGGYDRYGKFDLYVTSQSPIRGIDSDPDDTFAEARSLQHPTSTWATRDGEIDDPHDVDVYRFSVAQDVTYEFDIDLPQDSPVDPVIQIYVLFEGRYRLVAGSDDDAGEGESESLESFLSFKAPVGGMYFAVVSAAPNYFPNLETGGEDFGHPDASGIGQYKMHYRYRTEAA